MDIEKQNLSRRQLLSLGLTAGALTAVSTTIGKGFAAETPDAPGTEDQRATYALIIDTTVCTGCGACVAACNIKNELPEGQSFIHPIIKGDERTRWYLMVQCQHCAVMYCNQACPTDATYIRDDGVVILNDKLCVGCKACIYACPYQARIFNEQKGVADKCWLCMDLVLGGGLPACVQACIPGARIFGRSDDPNSQASQLIASGLAKPLHPEFGTRPAVLRYIIEE